LLWRRPDGKPSETDLASSIDEEQIMDSPQAMGRVEEILEIAAIVSEAAERLVTVLERSGADDPDSLRELARDELELAAAYVARLAFGSPNEGASD
jgi:hypothetical protein